MKKPLFNLYNNLISTYLKEKSFINKFIRYWGTTTVNGEEVLVPRNYWYNSDQEDWNAFSPFTPMFPEDCLPPDDAPSGMPTKCTRQRKLIEFLGAWEQLKAQKKKGIDDAWFVLNPRKAENVYDTVVTENLQKYIDTQIDKQGRLKFKVRVPISTGWIPGEGPYNPNSENYDSSIGDLYIAGANSPETLQEVVYKLDENGEIVYREVLVKDPVTGKITGTGTYEPVMQTENVISYTLAKKSLRGSLYRIWPHFPVIASTTNSLDNYEELLARYMLFYAPEEKVRVEFVQRGLMQYERVESREGDIYGGYNSYVAPSYVTYKGANQQTWGENYLAVYNLPVYEITYVVRLRDLITGSKEVPSSVVNKILEDAQADYWTTDIGEVWNTPNLLLYGRVNGYLTYKNLRSMYGESDDPETITRSQELYGLRGYRRWIGIPNPHWWVYYDNGYCLRVGVLKGDIDNLSREQAIELISKLIDSDYDDQDSGSNIFAIIIIIIAIIVTIFFPNPYTAGTIQALAFNVVVFAVVIQVGMTIAASTGNLQSAQTLGNIYKAVSPAVQVASIILAVDALYNGSQWLASSASSASNMTAEQIVSKVMDWAKTKLTTLDANLIRTLNSVADFYYKNELESLEKKNKSKQKRMEEYLEGKEQSKLGNIAMEAQNSLLNPLAVISSSYEFDKPFEPVFGSMHTGNSCRTSTLAVMGEGANTYFRNVV